MQILRIFLLPALGLLGACDTAPTPSAQRSALRSAPTQHLLLPWGEGPQQLALHRAVSEALDEGPSAVAIDSEGHVLIVDRLNHRVVRLGDSGIVASSPITPDVELIAAGPGGSFAAYSPLRAHVTVVDFAVDGASKVVGEIAVPRGIREAQGINLGPSRRIEVTTSFQETFQLGSPSFALPLPVVMQSKEEGMLRFEGGKRAQVVRVNGATELQVIGPRGERTPIQRTALEGDAAMLVGATGNVACARTETLPPNSAEITVTRRAVCVDVTSGKQVLSIDLPAPGLYLPKHELAVGAGRIATIVAESDGLAVDVYDLPSVRGGGAR